MSDADAQHPGRFATTHWSLILAARDGDAPAARLALARLCEAYWYPLYAYVRRRGHGADDAQDLTQDFFARLLARDFLGSLDPARGRFRAFLLAACNNFLANEYDRSHAQKRGGGVASLSLDLAAAEGRYGREPSHEMTPEKLFQRRWALTLLDRVLARLREDYTGRGKGPLFDHLRVFLAGEQGAPSHAAAADGLGMTAGAVKVAVHRLRQQYRDLLRAEIAHTVEAPEQVDEEIRDLFAALGD
jgi:RNA polymerase sigma-70 factor (ECF subfamily)